MIQLVLDGIEMPESRDGGYVVDKKMLSVDVEMITGRMVRELRGNVWTIKYQYGYFDTDMRNRVIAACEKGQKEPITCGFLPQTSAGELTYSQFFVTNFKRPVFMWGKKQSNGTTIPLWADFSVELREVAPSD